MMTLSRCSQRSVLFKSRHHRLWQGKPGQSGVGKEVTLQEPQAEAG